MLRLLDSVQWNAYVYRLDLCLYSHLSELLGVKPEPVSTLMAKTPQLDSSEEGQTHYAASCRIASQTDCQMSYSTFHSIVLRCFKIQV